MPPPASWPFDNLDLTCTAYVAFAVILLLYRVGWWGLQFGAKNGHPEFRSFCNRYHLYVPFEVDALGGSNDFIHVKLVYVPPSCNKQLRQSNEVVEIISGTIETVIPSKCGHLCLS